MTNPFQGGEPPPEPDNHGPGNIGPLTSPDGAATPAPAGTAVGLVTQAQRLAGEVAALRQSADTLAKRASRNEWAVSVTAIGLALDIALSVLAFVLLSNQSSTNARLETSIHETCTLYGFIIPSYRESARAASPLGPEGYDNFFRAMQTSADHLRCNIPHRI